MTDLPTSLDQFGKPVTVGFALTEVGLGRRLGALMEGQENDVC